MNTTYRTIVKFELLNKRRKKKKNDKMGLTPAQTEELYRTTLENRTDIGWIRECLEKNNSAMSSLSKRQSVLESEQSILKGKLGSFILVLTFAATLLFNGSLFILSHFRGD